MSGRDLLAEASRRWARVPRQWQVLAVLVAGAAAVVAGSGLVVAELVDDVLGADGVTHVDPRVTDWVVRNRSAGLTTLARGVTTLGDPLVVILTVAVAAIALVVAGRRRLAIFVVVSSAGAALVTTTGKLAVGRPRPPAGIRLVEAAGAAFPSGHATQGVACWTMLAVVGVLLTRRRSVRIALLAAGVALAVAVGSSRVYLGVHWTSDVVCGWAVATLWLTALLLIGWAGPRVRRAVIAAVWVEPTARR